MLLTNTHQTKTSMHLVLIMISLTKRFRHFSLVTEKHHQIKASTVDVFSQNGCLSLEGSLVMINKNYYTYIQISLLLYHPFSALRKTN